MPPPLKKEMYPKPEELFWEEEDWEKWMKKGKEKGVFKRGKQGEGVNSSWMLNQDRTRVSRDRQQQIIGEARHIWVTMRSFKIDFTVFRGTDLPTLDYFRARVETAFPELQLCANHWKADRLWMENYSSWNSKGAGEAPKRTTKEPEAAPQHPVREVRASWPQESTF